LLQVEKSHELSRHGSISNIERHVLEMEEEKAHSMILLFF